MSNQWRKLGLVMVMVMVAVCGVAFAPGYAADEEESGGGTALECVGGLSITHAHTSLAFIGVTADAFVKDVYEADVVAELMGGLIGGIDANKKSLRKLQDELEGEDDAYLDSILGVYNALENEAKALIKFTKTKSDADAKAFEKARLTAVDKLEELIKSLTESDE